MRTLKRSFLVTASVAALLLSATAVKAAVVGLAIDTSQSTLTLSGSIVGGPVGAVPRIYAPQTLWGPGPNSLIASYNGTINIDLQPGTIQLLPGSSINAINSGNWGPAPGPGGPNDDPVGGFGTSGQTPSVYGVQINQIATLSTITNLAFDFGVAPIPVVLPGGLPSTPIALVGNSFNLTGQGLSPISGARRILTFGNGLINDNSGFSLPTIFGSNNAGGDIGSWDGTTLILPVHSTITYDIGEGAVDTFTLTGQIVAVVVPEPSTVLMAGMGIVGLVAAGYRARKRKA